MLVMVARLISPGKVGFMCTCKTSCAFSAIYCLCCLQWMNLQAWAQHVCMLFQWQTICDAVFLQSTRNLIGCKSHLIRCIMLTMHVWKRSLGKCTCNELDSFPLKCSSRPRQCLVFNASFTSSFWVKISKRHSVLVNWGWREPVTLNLSPNISHSSMTFPGLRLNPTTTMKLMHHYTVYSLNIWKVFINYSWALPK